MDTKLETFLAEERARQLEELKAFLRIPSISANPENADDMKQAAAWLADALRQAGLEHVEIFSTAGHPVVYADWLHAPGKPTALIYGHYDVQPVDPPDQWISPPFEPEIRDGKLFARGATDDKGQLFLHIKTVEAFLKTGGSLPVNVKFCLEGEEEISSPSLPAFLETHTELLQADAVVISDGPMHEPGTPSICIGLRGLCCLRIDVSGPRNELHSGLYGGGVANPIHALAEILAKLHDTDGRVSIEGFYDDVRPLTDTERAQFHLLDRDTAKVCGELGVPELFGEKGYSLLERTTARPTLEINGISGGYEGSGLKPIVPSSAFAYISCRLVDHQEPDRITDLLVRHIEKIAPQGVTVTMTPLVGGKPFLISPDHPYIQAAAAAYTQGFGKPPVFIRSGGSIPIVQVFSHLLGTPVVMMDFGLPEENMHGPNEHFHLDNFDKGLATLCHYWQELGSMNDSH